ncbi:MAG TPA: gamma-glutamyl-gamma-aminobutyrate hydrolase family protein [Solirubrobacteraceae bacterium]|nr:gamma-glutamyl-gamma-aminobutyrate hydrolase family protein [Solirubrobacteraceae bacterium]
MTRPLILVNTWRRPLPTFLGERTVLDTLDPAYADGVSAAGGRPLLVGRPPGGPTESAEAAREYVALADGLLLSGGGDVDPASYGEAPDNVADEDPAADVFELALIEAARAAGLPTLAVCRGAQLLAVAHGGRLHQRPAAAEGHGELKGMAAQDILGARHPVVLAADSRIRRAFGRDAIAVNTIHHHQIAHAGELRVTATAPGAVIEAVEPRTEWPCVGVQWHPEKMHEADQRVLFAQLVQDARAGRKPGLAAA